MYLLGLNLTEAALGDLVVQLLKHMKSKKGNGKLLMVCVKCSPHVFIFKENTVYILFTVLAKAEEAVETPFLRDFSAVFDKT